MDKRKKNNLRTSSKPSNPGEEEKAEDFKEGSASIEFASRDSLSNKQARIEEVMNLEDFSQNPPIPERKCHKIQKKK